MTSIFFVLGTFFARVLQFKQKLADGSAAKVI